MEALIVKEVSKHYAEHTALDKVSISIPEKTIFGLLGPNGAGKTTLIRIINQIINRDEGEIIIFGEKLKPGHVENIGYLPEERGLYKKMKVGDQLIYVNVWTPKKLTAEEKAKLESLRSSTNFHPHPDADEKGFFERMKEYFG